MSVYSVNMAGPITTTPLTDVAIYTVPTGKVAVVRSVQVLCVGSGSVFLRLSKDGGATKLYWYRFSSGTSGVAFNLDCRFVMEAGWILYNNMNAAVAGLYTTVSGYELDA